MSGKSSARRDAARPAASKDSPRASSAKSTAGKSAASSLPRGGSRTAPTQITGPTYLTILRMVLSAVFVVFALMPSIWARIVALVLFVAASITDLIDGKWARKRKVVTDLGAFLDPLADKMLVNLAFLVLVYLNVVPLWVFAVILVRDFAVDGMRMMAARSGVTIAASKYGKWKTAFQMTALIVILLNLIVNVDFFAIVGCIALYVALILTIFSGYDYLHYGYRKLIKR